MVRRTAPVVLLLLGAKLRFAMRLGGALLLRLGPVRWLAIIFRFEPLSALRSRCGVLPVLRLRLSPSPGCRSLRLLVRRLRPGLRRVPGQSLAGRRGRQDR